MFNLLPYPSKVKIRTEYKRRVFVVVALVAFSAELVAGVLLLPTIILSRARENDFKARLDELSAITAESSGSFASFLKETTEKLNELSPEANRAVHAPAVSAVAAARVPGVHVTNITYTAKRRFESADLVVDGVADSREALLLFKKALEASDAFGSVDLPISNFAKDSDIRFTVTLELSFKPASDAAATNQ